MKYEDRLDSLLQYWAEKVWPDTDWLLIKAQVAQESAFRPMAISASGAKGLLQLMPATDLEIDGEVDGFDVEGNLKDGITYLKTQYDHFKEIPDSLDRIRFALASYNCGRGYINVALELARRQQACDLRYPNGKYPPGTWQTWETTRTFLAVDGCKVGGKQADYRQTWAYVEKIMTQWRGYRDQALA